MAVPRRLQAQDAERHVEQEPEWTEPPVRRPDRRPPPRIACSWPLSCRAGFDRDFPLPPAAVARLAGADGSRRGTRGTVADPESRTPTSQTKGIRKLSTPRTMVARCSCIGRFHHPALLAMKSRNRRQLGDVPREDRVAHGPGQFQRIERTREEVGIDQAGCPGRQARGQDRPPPRSCAPGRGTPNRSAASMSPKTKTIGPSTNSPWELTHATWTSGNSRASRGTGPTG